jgi:DNA-binding MarR family transcriptional regulator
MFQVLEEKPDMTQRSLSSRLGIALGMTNTLLRRAGNQGLLKIKKNSANRLSYHLTQKGLVEKGRLMIDQIQKTLEFYSEARNMARKTLLRVKSEGFKKIAIYGSSNVSEIIYLTAKEVDLEVLAVVDEKKAPGKWLGLPCCHFDDLEKLGVEMLILDFLKKEELEQFNFPETKTRSLIG